MRILPQLLAGLAAIALSGCAGLEPRPELPVESAVPVGTGTVLDGLIAEAEARRPGQSGFRLVREGPEAVAIRSRAALVAGRSLPAPRRRSRSWSSPAPRPSPAGR